MEKDWMQVFNTADRQRAWVVRAALESEGIKVVMLDKTSSPYTMVVTGELELYVHVAQAEQALDIIYRVDEDN